MRKLSDEAFLEEGNREGHLEATDQERLRKAIPLLKERAHTFGEAQSMIAGELACLFLRPTLELEKLTEKESSEGATLKALNKILQIIENLTEFMDSESIKAQIMPIADENPKDLGGRGAVLWPLRYALSGQERSPDPFSLIYILGKEESVLRIEEAIGILE